MILHERLLFARGQLCVPGALEGRCQPEFYTRSVSTPHSLRLALPRQTRPPARSVGAACRQIRERALRTAESASAQEVPAGGMRRGTTSSPQPIRRFRRLPPPAEETTRRSRPARPDHGQASQARPVIGRRAGLGVRSVQARVWVGEQGVRHQARLRGAKLSRVEGIVHQASPAVGAAAAVVVRGDCRGRGM